MSTSLAEQLKRLAAPQTSLLERDKKKRASLLFDPKEAAGIRRETIYQIGVDGLEELILKNNIFEQYRNSLYHESSKNFERAVETQESNKKINKAIRRFLLHLSPYFLLNCTHKALEWLINRFHIQEYNREDLLMLAMPYHESNIFVRVVQLLKFQDSNDSWYFLMSVQKTGVHLTKHSLLNKAGSDVYFLKFVAKFIGLLVKEHQKPNLLTVAFNFYCAVYAGAIEFSQEVTQAQITQMLPTLIKGLNSEVTDYCAASYVILSKLVTKTTLTDLVLDKFIEKVSEAKAENLRQETALMLILLYQTQKHYVKVPEEACINLAEKSWLPKILQELNKSGCYIWPFMEVLFQNSVHFALKSDQEVLRNFVNDLLTALKFDDVFVGTFLCVFLDATKSKKKYEGRQQKWLTEVIETLERQYPEQFDEQVYKILSSTSGGPSVRRKKRLQDILKGTMTLRGKFDIFGKLYHPNPAFRSEAIKFLTENFNSLKEGEKEMIKNSFIDRLSDDNVIVVKDSLILIETVAILDRETLRKNLLEISRKCQQDLVHWQEISTEVAIMLCLNSDLNDWETFLAVFPHLLPSTDDQLRDVMKICKTDFIKQNRLLKLNPEEAVSSCEEFCNNIFDSLKSDNFDLVQDFVRVLQKTPPEDRDVLHKYLSMLILSCILPENCPIYISSLIIEIFVSYFNSCEIKYERSNALFPHHIKAARQGKFPVEAFLLCMKNVVTKTQKSLNNLGMVDFSENNEFSRFFALAANILFKNVPNYKKYCKVFLDYFCKDLKSKIDFILNLAVSENQCLESGFQMNCINLVMILLKNTDEDFTLFVDMNEILVLYILALVLSRSEEVRKKSLKIVEILAELKKQDSYISLLKCLLNQEEEIILDEEQVPLIIFNQLVLSESDKGDNEKTKLRNALVQGFCNKNHPLYLKAHILKALSHINLIDIFEATSVVALQILKSDSGNLNEVKSAIVVGNILRCEAKIADKITFHSNVWNFIEASLMSDSLGVKTDKNVTCPSVLFMNQIDKEFIKNLSEPVEERLLSLIIETAATTQNPDVSTAANHVFKHIDLDGKLILGHFVKMRDVQSPKLDPNKLKRRISVIPTLDILDTLEWKRGVTTLEYIQDKKKIRNIDILLPLLFDVLKKCLDFDEQAAVEYPKQLILSSILHFCSRLEKGSFPENNFNMELVVQCIRASRNPQTHHHALLVLAYSANLFPTQVLHHVMAIFTFVGSSVLRHDDAYSFQIISRIIETIIPILIQNKEAVITVLRVFVDALVDVPEHRRLPIYSQLLTTLGVEENLYIFLLLVFESHVNHSQRIKTKGEETTTRLNIATTFCLEFSPQVVILTFINLMKLLKEWQHEFVDENFVLVFDIIFKTSKQFRHYKYVLITFVNNLLSSKEFVNQVASLSDDKSLALEELHRQMIILVLTYIQSVSKVAEENANTPQAQYWKVILHHSYDILDSVNALLTPQIFLLVIKGLMLHNLNTARRRALELLNVKLQHNLELFQSCEREELYSLIPPLLSIIKSVEENQLEAEQECIVQTALLSLKLLVNHLAPHYLEKFREILEFIIALIKNGKAQNNVLASVVLCLAELCVSLRTHAISSLPSIMSGLLKILKQQTHLESPSLLLLSAITAIQNILEPLALFMSPYLEKLLCVLSVLASRWGTNETEDQRLQSVVKKLTSVCQKIGSTIPSRVLIPAIEMGYEKLIEKNSYEAVGPLMNILAENLNTLSGPELNSTLPELQAFFLKALELRASGKTSMQQTNEVESQVIKALIKLILKLSETSFRSVYVDLFKWAVNGGEKSERIITFYALSSEIAECLKGLFVLFAGYFLNDAAQILNACNTIKNEDLYFEDKDKTILLLEYVLKTLHAVFMYDNQKFINKERFEILMQPLVDQLDNVLGGIEKLERRNETLVTPCIVQFAVALADDAPWKQVNYQMLLKMRHTLPNIRLIALHCLTETVRKLGEDFLSLLPETIPFLAELLEDEEEVVETACRKAVQEMEKILGEPLQKYF